MASKEIVVVDSDILIKVYRGDATKKSRIAVSIITVLEFSQGLNSKVKLFAFYKQLKAYQIIHLDSDISQLAYQLSKKYSVTNNVRVQDVLIAATSIVHNCKLFTDNKKDYSFIKEVAFYEP